jgi:hypothetical protein
VIGGKQNKNLELFILLLLLFSLLSCGTANAKNVVLDRARQSFLYLEKTISLEQCGDHKCLTHELNSMASGFIIKTNSEGAYGITAAHVCEAKIPETTPPIKHKSTYRATTLSGNEYTAVVLASDIEHDICLIYIEGLTGVPSIRVAPKAPEPGDPVYNIGAPRGIYQPNMVPMFEGIYNGKASLFAFYSLPANPGSSGSMIINTRGELVGVLHSVYIKFPHIILSVRYDAMAAFIKKNIIKFETYKMVMDLLELQDVFSGGNKL